MAEADRKDNEFGTKPREYFDVFCYRDRGYANNFMGRSPTSRKGLSPVAPVFGEESAGLSKQRLCH